MRNGLANYRVGDCFDPILDPTPDRNPFRIEIKKVWIAIKNFWSQSDLFGFRSAIQITIGIVFFLFNVRLLKLCKISNIFFNGENDV